MIQTTRTAIGLILLVGILATGCRTGRRLEVPTPATEDFRRMELTAVHALSEDVLYVCGWLDRHDGGSEGLILRSDDAGAHWRRVGAETARMDGFVPQALAFADARRGWVAGVRVGETGTNAVVLRTTDGGGHWRERAIAVPRAEFVSHLQSLSFDNDDVGRVEVVYLDAETGAYAANRYRTQDGGRHWIVSAFRDVADDEVVDGAWHDISDSQAYRLRPLDADGVQVLEFSASAGKTWRRVAEFHVSRFAEFYGPWDHRTEMEESSPERP